MSAAGRGGKSAKAASQIQDNPRVAPGADRVGDKQIVLPTPDRPALKGHKTLFIVLMIALVIWVGFLVTMYVTTVRGRQPGDKPPGQTNHPHPALPTRAYRA